MELKWEFRCRPSNRNYDPIAIAMDGLLAGIVNDLPNAPCQPHDLWPVVLHKTLPVS